MGELQLWPLQLVLGHDDIYCLHSYFCRASLGVTQTLILGHHDFLRLRLYTWARE